MDRAKYNEIIEKLTECVLAYKKGNMFSNKVLLYLGNGEIVNVRFPKNGVAHLLGVNIEYLKLSNLFPKKANTFEYLEYFLENSYSFGNLMFKEKKLSVNKVFSDNIQEKLSCFWENIHIRIDDLITVVKYNSEKTYQAESMPDISDYYIVRRKHGKYYLLGLVRNEERGVMYVPTTSRQYDDFFEYEKFMSRICYNQELTYINNQQIDNDEKEIHKNFFLTLDEKITKLDYLINLGKKYTATVSVGNDLLFQLKKSKNGYEKENSLTDLLISFKNKVDARKIFEVKDRSIFSEELLNLIDSYNNFICNDVSADNSVVKAYSKVVEDNTKLKEELKKKRAELLEMKEENRELQGQFVKTLDENEFLNSQLGIYHEAEEKIKKLKQGRVALRN